MGQEFQLFSAREGKAKVVLEAVRGVKTINEIGQEHAVHPLVVEQWRREMLACQSAVRWQARP